MSAPAPSADSRSGPERQAVPRILALDGGQSGIRTLLSDASGARPGPEFTGIRSDQPLLQQVGAIVLSALAGTRVETVALGLSGLGPADRAEDLQQMFGDAAGSVLLAHDATTSFLGALGNRQGAVVASGTGSVTLAVGPESVRRIDGWGHLLGDAGSGFWIGTRALSAVLRAHDGRGEPTALAGYAEEEFGDLDQLYLQLQADPGRVARIASWARRVSELAATDAVCRSISRSAGQELARSAVAGILAVGADPVVSFVGNVFLNQLVASSFAEELNVLLPGVSIVPAAGSGLDGAAQMVNVDPGSAIDTLISRASRIPCTRMPLDASAPPQSR